MRNCNIDAWRFIFSILIVVYHFQGHIYGLGLGGYIAVEFFFILSGFLLCKTITAMKYANNCAGTISVEWLKSKWLSLFPHYFFSFLLVFFTGIILDNASILTIINRIVTSVYEVSFLQMSPLSFSALNNPTWYISAMLLSGYSIAFLLSKFEEVFLYFLAPISIVGMYGYLFIKIASLSITVETTPFEVIRYGNLRAFAGMALGVLSYKLYETLNSQKFKLGAKRVIVALGNFALLFSLVLAFFIRYSRLDFYFVILYSVAIPCTFLSVSNNSSVKKLTSYLGKISYAIYLNHLAFELIFSKYFSLTRFLVALPIYLLSIIVFSIISSFFVDSLTRWIENLFHRMYKNMVTT